MALQGLFWPDIAGRDIHLVPGSVSPRIDQLLAIQDSLGNTFASGPQPGVTVTFAPRFFGTPAAHGVTVSTATGQVTIASPLPAAPFLRNFIIDCTATQGITQFSRMIRVHVHPGILRHWVTPARLDVRLGTRKMRFSVLAEFADGAFGDITNWGAFDTPTVARDQIFAQTNTTPRRPALTRSSNSPGITVDAQTTTDTRGHRGSIEELEQLIQRRRATRRRLANGILQRPDLRGVAEHPAVLLQQPENGSHRFFASR